MQTAETNYKYVYGLTVKQIAFFAKPRKSIFNIFSISAVHPVFQLRIPMVIYRHIWDFPFIPIIKDIHC